MANSSTTATDARTDETHDQTIRWLLDGDPAIRWQVKRDLLDAPTEHVQDERALVSTTGWGRQLLDRHDPEGTWGGGLYSPKWTSTTYTLLLLRHCGLDPANEQARRGVTLIWEGARYFDGGLTPAVSIDAPEACATSLYLALAFYFDVDHPNVAGALEWLLANQLDDGGWNCRTARFGDRHSSFHTSISALEALTEAQRRLPGRADIADAMVAGREFFLRHRLYKSHRHGTIAHPAFTKLSFPPRWHYDLLRGLDHFATTAAPWDDRYRDALDVLRERRRRDDTWPAQNKHSGRVWFDMEPTGKPSRWNTLRALRVQRWHEQATST